MIQIAKQGRNIDIALSNFASDKSISHRCAIFALLSDKPSHIRNYLQAEDTLNTLKIAQALGAKINTSHNKDNEIVTTITPPSNSLLENKYDKLHLDCGNSGTALRLIAGLLCALDGEFVLSGDKYLQKRPMGRIINPLKEANADINSQNDKNTPPLIIKTSNNKTSFDYTSLVSSAQVKSALILYALHTQDKTSYFKEPYLSRDHSERMLKGMGADISQDLKTHIISINPLKAPLKPLNLKVPNDPSSAFFFAVLCAITPNINIKIEYVSLNKTRIGAFKILEQMGLDIRYKTTHNEYEPIGDIFITNKNKTLKAIEVSKNISWLIDELPALSIAMAFCEGKSIIKNAKELRVKECDRISSVVTNLEKLGIKCDEFEDGYSVYGVGMQGEINKNVSLDSFGDHRIAMSFLLLSEAYGTKVKDIECIYTSFPNFIKILDSINREL